MPQQAPTHAAPSAAELDRWIAAPKMPRHIELTTPCVAGVF
jgi:hypothetical protein